MKFINKIKILEFDSRLLLAKELATIIAKKLTESVNKNGYASLVVSGGSTPELFFEALSDKNIPWKMVSVSMADERCVSPRHRDSNEKFIKTKLLRGRAKSAQFVALYNDAENKSKGLKECALRLSNIRKPFTVVVLGMGDDGHTASLFPGAINLKQALCPEDGQICMAITPPHAPYERVTLTLPALLDSKRIVLHIHGEKKRLVCEQAISGLSVEEMPIRAILLQKKVPVHVFWAP